jgi:para-nitrobenzyl esterase
VRRRTALIAAVPILLCCIGHASGGVRQQTGNPVVRIESGALEGTFDPENPGVAYFRGIPYAAPPVGKLRWKPPRPVEPWSGTRRAVELAPAAPQPDFLVGAQQRNAALLGGDPSFL